MTTLSTLISELEEAIKHRSAEKCADTVRRITDLFLEGAPRFSKAQVHLFDEVLGRLILEIETKALAELARRLAPIANAPAGVAQRLASADDIAVAAPMLTLSPRLTDENLVQIAQAKGDAHRLAISRRSPLSEAVTDVLVERGGPEVLRSAAGNTDARFSARAFAKLVDRAKNDEILADGVGQRPDIPSFLFRRLLLQATDVVQRRLIAAARPETQDEIRRVLAKIAREVADEKTRRDFGAALAAALAEQKSGRLNELRLAELAEAGRYDESIAALSVLCTVPIDVVSRLLGGERPDAVLILCRAAGFAWPTARAMIRLCYGAGLGSPQVIEEARHNFERLSTATALRIVHFWRIRDGALREAS